MNKNSVIPAHIRDWLYPIALAVLALLGGYGLIADQMVSLWAALIAAIFGLGTATAYRPGRAPGDAPDIEQGA
jgi:hypothetical protein